MHQRYCDGISRREALQVGAIGGLSLAGFLRLAQAQAAATGRPVSDKQINCIFLFCIGGMAHQDMWDPKPGAPAEIRGDFAPIATRTPGMSLTELLPGMAQVADKFSVLRGLTHTDPDHVAGYHVMMTGQHPGSGANFNRNKQNNNIHPALGSMVARMSGTSSSLPPYVNVPNFLNSGGPAFLGASYAPFVIEADPASPEFAVRDIVLPANIDEARSDRRQQALRQINRLEERVAKASKNMQALDTFYEKAYNLMTSAQAKAAFEIHRESDATRDRYGMTSLGQCCLLSRRLVEAGCRFVSIENGHWDTHRKNTMSLKELLVPALDQGASALLADLDERGMLDSTLVVVTTEFGRTPRINHMAGRDHWPGAFSIVMAGGGLKAGQVIGATDKQAAYVVDRPVSPSDMAATVLAAMGVDPAAIMHTPLGRPIQLAGGGRPVTELF